MSIKKLFQNNKQANSVGKYLKSSAIGALSGGMESAQHLSESLKRQKQFTAPLDYGNPDEFAKYGSAEKYYENSFNYILQNYPYDGSAFEKEKFYNDLNPLEKYIFNERYPKSTGFVNIGTNYGTAVSHSSHYFSSPKAEYIQVKGGPHSGTVFSSNFRQNNLEFGGPSGSTVEFFLSKSAVPGGSAVVTTQSPRQVIFDLWNGVSTGSVDDDETNGCYGNLRIELSKSLEDRFLVTMLSGTKGYVTQSIPTTGGVGNYITGSGFNHFAFVFNTSESSPTIDFYINGVCHEPGIAPTGHQAGQISLVTGSLIGNIGALRVAPSGVSDTNSMEGRGKLSGSIDEFRFWKTARSGEGIGRNWFTHVNGGTDIEDANVGLGVYYKFNEGVFGTSSVDNVVLDYSGRLSNGAWSNYAVGARDTGSAITQQSLTQSIPYRTETEDPIIIPSASALTVRRDDLKQIGEQHDRTNTSYILNTFPDWIVEQDAEFGSELKNSTQIISTYFDTLYSQVSYLTKIKSMDYISGSATGSIFEFPHNDRLMEELGVEAPEIFENASILSQFLKRDEDINFQHDLTSIKNTIYKNIYNNLNHILKSKGNEKAIRNLVRCFGIDEEIIKVNVYSDNSTYKLDNNYRADTSNKKYADFTGLFKRDSSDATIYQYPNPDLPEAYGVVSGSSGSLSLIEFGFTAECEFVFPNKKEQDTLSHFPVQVVTSSLFGWHTPRGEHKLLSSSTDTSWHYPNADSGLQVVAVKSASQMAEVISPDYKVKDVLFKVLDRHNNEIIVSPVFRNVYENQKWNIALSVHPKRFPFAQNSGANANVHDGYDIDFYAVNYDSGIRQESYYKTGSLTYKSGSDIVSAAKRYYVGAHRTNFTGTVLTSSDVRASSLRYWTDVLPTGAVDMHARSAESYGTLNPTRQAYTFQSKNPGVYVPQVDTLALHWDFADVTGSDASGRFNVNDFSSGSLDSGSGGDLFHESPQHINSRQHTGRGDFFPASDKPIRKELVYTDRLELPEYAISSDMVQIKNIDDQAYAPMLRPEKLFYAVEKSMYRSISERMLHLFASVEELNNLIGDPVNRYRQNYKSMEKLRQIFFSKVGNIPDLQKYLDYYKWLDSSLGQMLEQMFPASAKVAPGVRNIIESHLLERSKFNYTFMGNRKKSTRQSLAGGDEVQVIANAQDPGELLVESDEEPPPQRTPYAAKPVKPPKNVSQTKNLKIESAQGENVSIGYAQSHAPLPSSPPLENENRWWWMTRAERDNITIVQSDAGVMKSRNAIFKQAKSFYAPNRLVTIGAFLPKENQPTNQGIGNVKESKTEVAVAKVKFGGLQLDQDVKDVFIPNLKQNRQLSASIDGDDIKGQVVLPFTPVSSTVHEGYQKQLQDAGLTNVDFSNLHVRPVAVQSPFTLAHVGGQQARSAPVGAKLNQSDNVRKESYQLEIADGAGEFDKPAAKTPKGQYKRGTGASRPVNVANIQTLTTDIAPEGGARVLGNFSKFYEVLNTSDRSVTNVDLAFSPEAYHTSSLLLQSGTMPSAFLTDVPRRTQGLTGSAEFTAPRQRAGVRTNKTIIADRFSAPGSKEDSKQLFRDRTSDQFSPNNALPFRNIKVRQRYNTLLKRHTGFGGFQTSSLTTLLDRNDSTDLGAFNEGIVILPAVHGDPLSIHTASLVAVHKTQRNTILRAELASYNLNSPLVPIMTTGSVRDNAFVTRPIPAGDRYSWFMALSHSQGTPGDHPGQNVGDNFHFFILSASRYPGDITLYTSSIAHAEKYKLYPGTFAAQANGVFSNSAGGLSYIWERNGAGLWAPWTQTRYGQFTTKGMFNSKQNFYIIDAANITRKAESVEQVAGKKLMVMEKGETVKDFTKSIVEDNDNSLQVYLGSVGNTVTHRIAKRYKEPPLTSRYKPILHQIKTKRGTPALTDKKSVDVTVKYSYGNELQGFANRGLNIDLGNKQDFKLGQLKRPYEIIRDTFVDGVDPSIDGVELIKMMSYKETIYPREIYAYLSATRARNFYRNNFWRSDIATGSVAVLTARSITELSGLLHDHNIKEFNNSWERRITDEAAGAGFSSSFDYYVKMDEQFPIPIFQGNTSGNQGYIPPVKTTPYVDAEGNRNPGSGSMWPLDSFYYAEFSGALPTSSYSGTNIGNNLLFCMASTMPAGELMMPHYGIVMSGNAANSSSELGGIRFNTSSVNSPQYIYSVPTEKIRTTDLANGKAIFIAEPNAVAGPVARPAWTAGRKRKFVDGPKKNSLAPARFPWYNNYENWQKELRNLGKDYTIIPEYRISELMPTYKELGSFGTVLSGALSVTGATNNTGTNSPFNSADREFLPRYATSDAAEYLKTFMKKGSKDAEFNKDPRHLEIKSEALLKLLPYEGFYPVLRTLELARLFSQSYGPAIEYSGEGYTPGAPNFKDITSTTPGENDDKNPRSFRTISRPFFAPGIVYNSIKAGVAVQYPILRKGMSAFTSASIQDPLAGQLSSSVFFSLATGDLQMSGASETAITLPGGRRRRKEGTAENFDFFKLDVAVEGDQLKDGSRGAPHRMFYSDVIPFEGIFKPMEHISSEKRGVVLADSNPVLYQEITGSVPTTGALVTSQFEGEAGMEERVHFVKFDDDLYRLGMSNFMANVPRFFLKKQNDGGFMSKFVAEIPSRATADNPAGAAAANQNEARTVAVSKDKAYIMEIGMKQTDRHMMYSNPAAFGPPTATGSFDWNEMLAAGPGATTPATVTYGAQATASLEINTFDENILDGKFIGITGSTNDGTTTAVTFEFDKNVAPGSPAKTDATNYTIGCQSVSDAPAVGTAILNAFNLASTNGDFKTVSSVNGSTGTVTVKQLLRTAKFNGLEIVGSSVNPDQAGAGVTVEGPFAGGQLAPLFTVATTQQSGGVPQGKDWPHHRAEFAPYTPSYYYGPSVVRITYVPKKSGEVTLREILSGEELFVEYNNENGYYYDFDSGSYVGANDQVFSLDGVPAYGFNRAWQNRQDLDSSVVIDNVYPTDAADVSPRDQNKWVIMPKWECPVLDFPTTDGGYNYSASVNVGEHDPKVRGMWHQYGTMPSSSVEGVFMYISDVSVESTELRLLGNPTGSAAQRSGESTGTVLSGTAKVEVVRKVPKFVIDSGREVDSLARLVGFKEDSIQAPGTFQPEKAKRLGQLAESGEKTISEAVLAMPYYLEPTTQEMKVMTLKGNMDALGPKVKEFRKNFTKYSLPPSLKKQLTSLLPPNYPKVSKFINPFGGDDYDSIIPTEEDVSIPIVYLLEHTVGLSRQDLADIWQGIMPDIAATMKTSVSSIDHYMPGDRASGTGNKTVFPEILLKELELGIPRNGHPRVDLIDVAPLGSRDGFIPEIKWMIFKVKERGVDRFSTFISEELNGGPGSFSYDNVFGVIAENLPQEQKDFLKRKKTEYTKGLFVSDDLGVAGNTYNWPYDYCSLVEMGKLSVNVGFRPELERETEDISEDQETNARSRGERNKKVLDNKNLEQRRLSSPPRILPATPLTPPAGATIMSPPPGAEALPQMPNTPLPGDMTPPPEGMTPPPLGQPQEIDPFAGEAPASPEQFDPGKIPAGEIPEQFRDMTPAQMERRRAEEMSKAQEQRQPPPSFRPPRGGGNGGGGSGGGGY